MRCCSGLMVWGVLLEDVWMDECFCGFVLYVY